LISFSLRLVSLQVALVVAIAEAAELGIGLRVRPQSLDDRPPTTDGVAKDGEHGHVEAG
jgi:hypothetical protein